MCHLIPTVVTLLVGVQAFAAEGEYLTESGFQQAPAGQTETIDGGALLLAAYAVAWLLIAGYVYIIARRSRETQAELQAINLLSRDLESRLDEYEEAR
jgi:CcmD family protein